MDGIVRLTAAVNRINCANPKGCLDEIKRLLKTLPESGSDIVAFPQLALCSPGCGGLMLGSGLTEACAQALEELLLFTKDADGYILAGLPVEDLGRVVSATAILYRGELVALVSTADSQAPFSAGPYSENILPADTVFSCGDMRFCVLGCELPSLGLRAAAAAESGCDLLILSAYSPVRAGLIDEVLAAVQTISRAAGCAVAVVNGGVGDSSSPYLYCGFAAVYECGEQLACLRAERESVSVTVDLDADIIRSQKKSDIARSPSHNIPGKARPELLRKLRTNPFIPESNPEAYLSEVFDFQVRSLSARMENTGIKKLVIGVSGGLDSTAALLVCAAVCDRIKLPRENIYGVTMPGPGTSGQTYRSALALLESLGVTRREIPIGDAVSRHLEDIGHDGRKDVTYENTQARERAQILLDLANMTGGLVVGTGDLSEEALGFCTFAGDHIANYNVNVCVTKTVLRELVRHVAETGIVPGVKDIVMDILQTPVSPELLPPDESGGIGQKTEEILGPYLLHDFFLYHFVRHRFSTAKLFQYACLAFAGSLEPDFIKAKLELFFRRFCAGQFKRACAPDAASITEVNLCGVNYYIPSDLDPLLFF